MYFDIRPKYVSRYLVLYSRTGIHLNKKYEINYISI